MYYTFGEIKHLSNQEPKTLQELGLKLTEESGELTQAILSATKASGCEYKGLTLEDVQEEAVDVILVALSIYYALDGETLDLLDLMDEKARKWRKTMNDEWEETI